MNSIKLKGRMTNKQKLTMWFCFITSLLIGFRIAYANALADLVNSILGNIIDFIMGLIVSLVEVVVSIMLYSMKIDIDVIHSWGLLDGFDLFVGIICALAVGIASLAVLWQLLTVLMGPMVGSEQPKSVGRIILRALVFIPLTYVAQPVAMAALKQMQVIYSQMLDGYMSVGTSGSGAWQGISGAVSSEEVMNAVQEIGAGNLILDTVASIVSIVLWKAIILIILWEFLNLLLELGLRFAIMLVYVYLSPLAVACGVIGEGEIPKKSLTAFMSNGVIWLLSVWCMGISLNLMSRVGESMENGGIYGLMIWAVLTYGFIRLSQKLDDLFNMVGATNLKLDPQLLQTMMGAYFSMSKLGGKIGAAVGMAKQAWENSANNPAKPTDGGMASAAAGGGENPEGSSGVQSGPAPNMGSRAQVKNIQASQARVDQNKKAAAVNQAIDGSLDAEQRKENRQALAEQDPGIYNSAGVKDYYSQKMGLEPNQTLMDMKYNKDEDSLTGTVATKDGKGNIQLSRVSNLEEINSNTDPISGNRLTNSARQTSKVDGSETGAKNLSDFGAVSGGSAGTKAGAALGSATMTYADKQGELRTAQVDKMDVLDRDNDFFELTMDNNGSAVIAAPKGTSAVDVANAINGTADSATMEKISSASGSPSAAAQHAVGVEVARSFAEMDSEVTSSSGLGAVRAGTAFENSPNTIATVSTQSNGKDAVFTFERTGMDGRPADDVEAMDTWTVKKDGAVVGNVDVRRNTGAAEVASQMMFGDSENSAHFRESAGISVEGSNPTVSFERVADDHGWDEPMRPRVRAGENGDRENGAHWSSWQTVNFDSENGQDVVTVTAMQRNEQGMNVPHDVKVTLSSEAEGARLFKVESDALEEPMFVATQEGVSISDFASSVMTGNGYGVGGADEVISALGVQPSTDENYLNSMRATLAEGYNDYQSASRSTSHADYGRANPKPRGRSRRRRGSSESGAVKPD